MTSQSDPVHSDGLAPPSIPVSVILDNPELTRGDLAVLAAILELGEGAYREDIAERAGMSEPKTSVAVTKLKRFGLIGVKRKFSKRTPKESKNFYTSMLQNGNFDDSSKLPNGNIDTLSKLPKGDIDDSSMLPNGNMPLGRKSKKGSKLPKGNIMNHELMNHESEILEKMAIFDFFRGPNRRTCAEECSLEDAKAWRELKDYYDTHQLWESMEGITQKASIGWMVRRIKEHYPPPPIQIPLPAASLDLTEPLRLILPTENESVWAQVQEMLRPQMTRGTYDTIIQGTQYLGRENGHHLIGAPSEMAKEWLENRLRDVIKRSLTAVLQTDAAEVKFALMAIEGANYGNAN